MLEVTKAENFPKVMKAECHTFKKLRKQGKYLEVLCLVISH